MYAKAIARQSGSSGRQGMDRAAASAASRTASPSSAGPANLVPVSTASGAITAAAVPNSTGSPRS